LAQQVIGIRRVEQVDTPAVQAGELRFIAGAVIMAVEQIDIVPALLAPGSEQRMRMLVQAVLVELRRCTRAPFLPLIFMAQQILVADDVAPVMLTGIEYAQQYLAEATDRRQGFQILRWQGRNTEHNHPAW